MDQTLTAIEARVLGSLIEKEMTTPEYYPLTMNGLTNACNQKNNRSPVVVYEETMVARALESLRGKKMVFMVTGAGMRVPKYKHIIDEVLHISHPELAILGLLMLRGPQTLGELKNRVAPMHPFESLDLVQTTLDGMATNEHRGQLVKKLPRQPGQKESRFAHLLCGEPVATELPDTTQPEPAVIQMRADNERIDALEQDVAGLKSAIAGLVNQFAEFRKQFE